MDLDEKVFIKVGNDDDFIDEENTSIRIPVCLVLDASSSMLRILDDLTGVAPARKEFRDGQWWNIYEGDFTTYMSLMVKGVNLLYEGIREDADAADACEIAIVSFSDNVSVVENFSPVTNKRPFQELEVGDNTNMGAGILKALDLLENRKENYRMKDVSYKQPWLFIFTDGDPTDIDKVNEAAERCKKLNDSRKLTVYPISLGDEVNMDVLKKFCFGDITAPLPLKKEEITKFFRYLSASISAFNENADNDTGTNVFDFDEDFE